jgi:23S rRNA maturation mini-RNase III
MKRRKSFVFKVYEKSALQNVETHAKAYIIRSVEENLRKQEQKIMYL